MKTEKHLNDQSHIESGMVNCMEEKKIVVKHRDVGEITYDYLVNLGDIIEKECDFVFVRGTNARSRGHNNEFWYHHTLSYKSSAGESILLNGLNLGGGIEDTCILLSMICYTQTYDKIIGAISKKKEYGSLAELIRGA